MDVPPLPEYILEHFERSADAWHCEDNPNGYLGVCIAENRLVWDLLAPKAHGSRAVPESAFAYNAMIGSLDFRQRLAEFLGSRAFGRVFQPEQLAVLAGAGAVLEILFHVLCDPGDGVLVPTPSYAGFWPDLQTRDELKIVPVHTSSTDGFQLTTDVLDGALQSAKMPVKALLWTNPDNPRGAVASATQIESIVQWTERNGLHLVCDEIYAMSVFGGTSFQSCASLRPELGDRIHLVWAFSKDFAASGLRCGVLVSENEAVMQAVDALAYWAACSGDTQAWLGDLITDDSWVEHYLVEMPRRLGVAYTAVTAALVEEGIPFLPSEAGFFLLLDLRSFLAEHTFEAEHELWRRCVDEAGVNMTPGQACCIGEPGFMRFCFTAVPTPGAVAAVRRLGRCFRRVADRP